MALSLVSCGTMSLKGGIKMFEWLSGDPLCGIGTTVGFFIFLILGRYVRRKMVEKNEHT